MNVMVVCSVMRAETTVGGQTIRGWGGTLHGVLSAFSHIIRPEDTVMPVFRLGEDDVDEFMGQVAAKYRPGVKFGGILPDPLGTNFHRGDHRGEEEQVWSQRRVSPISYAELAPFFSSEVDALILNAGDVETYEDDIIAKASHAHPNVLVHVDVHRKSDSRSSEGWLTRTGWPGWQEALPCASVVQMSRPECGALLGKVSPAHAVDIFLKAGVRRVAVTLGPDGCVIGSNAESLGPTHLPATGPRVENPLGAGDAFGVGVVAAMIRGSSFQSAVDSGQRLAIEMIGAI